MILKSLNDLQIERMVLENGWPVNRQNDSTVLHY